MAAFPSSRPAISSQSSVARWVGRYCLAPLLVAQNFEIIEQINKAGTTVFMVEQNANMALSIADRGYVLQTGAIVLSDTAEGLLANPEMRQAYLGELD